MSKAKKIDAPRLPTTPLFQHPSIDFLGSVSDKCMLCYHPEEETIWVFHTDEETVRKIHTDGRIETVATGDKVGYPRGLSTVYLYRGAFYYDTKRKAPIWLLSSYDAPLNTGPLMGIWTGKRFEPLKQKQALPTGSGDGFGFDPERGVLVHFVGPRENDARRSNALTVREMGEDGVWRDLDAQLPGMGVFDSLVGWDARRKMLVLVDTCECVSWGWNGASFRPLGKSLDYPWKPCAFTISPRDGSLVYLQNQRSNTDFAALLFELGAKGWTKRDAKNIHSFGGGVYDSKRNLALFLGVWAGPGTVQHLFGRYDGETIQPEGPPNLPFSRGSASGPPRFWGKHEFHLPFFGRSLDDEHSCNVSARLDGGQLHFAPASPPVRRIVADSARLWGLGLHGETLELTDQGWRRAGPSPRIFVLREGASLGSDRHGNLLLAGGRLQSSRKNLTDVWRWNGKRWSEQPSRGATPSTHDGWFCFDEAREVWVLTGGHLGAPMFHPKPSPKTYEYDGAKWVAFPTQPAHLVEQSILLFARDEPSGQLFLSTASGQVYTYEGEGVWNLVAQVDFAATACAYDTERRTLVLLEPSSAVEATLGPILDAQTPPTAPAAKVTSPKPKAASPKPKSAAKGAAKPGAKKTSVAKTTTVKAKTRPPGAASPRATKGRK